MFRARHRVVTGGSFTVLVITTLLLVSACGGQRDLSKQLIGTWAEASESLYQVYEFSEDGTVTYSLLTSEASGAAAPTTITGAYELLETSMLVMRMPTETNIFGLTIANDRLPMRSPTITRADGTTTRGQDYVFNRAQ